MGYSCAGLVYKVLNNPIGFKIDVIGFVCSKLYSSVGLAYKPKLMKVLCWFHRF